MKFKLGIWTNINIDYSETKSVKYVNMKNAGTNVTETEFVEKKKEYYWKNALPHLTNEYKTFIKTTSEPTTLPRSYL